MKKNYRYQVFDKIHAFFEILVFHKVNKESCMTGYNKINKKRRSFSNQSYADKLL